MATLNQNTLTRNIWIQYRLEQSQPENWSILKRISNAGKELFDSAAFMGHKVKNITRRLKGVHV